MNYFVVLSNLSVLVWQLLLRNSVASFLFFASLYLITLYMLMISILMFVKSAFSALSSLGSDFFGNELLMQGVAWVLPNSFGLVISYVVSLYVMRFVIAIMLNKLDFLKRNPLTN